MKQIIIDLDYLIFVYQDDSPDNIYYLDTEYGDIRLVHSQLHDLRDLTDEIELSPNRFLYIPKANKIDLLSDLRDFEQQCTDPELKKIFAVAFESPHVLEAFKKILSKDPVSKKQLEAHLYNRIKGRLLGWLAANSLLPRADKIE